MGAALLQTSRLCEFEPCTNELLNNNHLASKSLHCAAIREATRAALTRNLRNTGRLGDKPRPASGRRRPVGHGLKCLPLMFSKSYARESSATINETAINNRHSDGVCHFFTCLSRSVLYCSLSTWICSLDVNHWLPNAKVKQ